MHILHHVTVWCKGLSSAVFSPTSRSERFSITSLEFSTPSPLPWEKTNLSRGVASHFFPFEPKFYSESRISNFPRPWHMSGQRWYLWQMHASAKKLSWRASHFSVICWCRKHWVAIREYISTRIVCILISVKHRANISLNMGLSRTWMLIVSLLIQSISRGKWSLFLSINVNM